MNTNLITSLRIVVSALAFVICFVPANANAYTSSGTDGQFQPTVSMIFDTTQQTFNFTSIFIPSDVTVSFSRLASAQPIELLATGNIDIAGTLDVGANNLWIETPGSISLSGSLYSSGGALSLVASTVNFSGIINGNDALTGRGSNITLTSGGGILTASASTFDGGDVITGGGGNITLAGGGGILVASAPTFVGGDVITGEGIIISALTGGSLCCSILSPVPEPDVWVMLLLGLCALFAVSRLRYQNIHLA